MNQVQNIPWKRISVEAAAIVASILLAFAIDAWWDDRLDQQQEDEVLAILLAEFEDNRTELDQTLLTLAKSHNAADQLLMFGGRTFAENDLSFIEQKLDELYSYRTFDPASGALHSLFGAGNLNLLSNNQLRTLLAGWTGMVMDYKGDEEELDYLLYRVLGPMLDAIAPLENVEDAAPEFFENQLKGAFQDVRFMNAIGNISYWAEASIEEAKLLGHEIDRITKIIKSEIEQ
jgi:hypothetical protein